jgi:HK97 family phage prohead protease
MGELITKTFEGLELTKSDDSYTDVSGTFSSSKRDREGDIVMQDFNLGEFERNPVLLFNHSTMHPIGKVMRVDTGKRKSKFKAVLSKTSFAQEVGKLMEEGIVRHASHRFKPGKAERSDKEDEGFTFSENTLVEISVVPIPANLDAVVQARSDEFPAVCKALGDGVCAFANEQTAAHSKQGVDENGTYVDENAAHDYMFQHISLPEDRAGEVSKPGWDETSSSFRYRLREPGQFVRIRTMTLKRSKPKIKATVGPLRGGGKSKLQSLIFPKSEGWTLKKAQAWKKAHPDVGKGLDEIFEVADEYEIDIPFLDAQEPETLTEERIRKYVSEVGERAVRGLRDIIDKLRSGGEH